MKIIFILLSLFSAIAWGIGFFVLKAGSLIHALLFISLLSYLRSFMCEQRAMKFKFWNRN